MGLLTVVGEGDDKTRGFNPLSEIEAEIDAEVYL